MKYTLLFLTFSRLCFISDCLLLDDKLTLNAECPELEEELVKCQKRNVELEEEIRILKVRYLLLFSKYIQLKVKNILKMWHFYDETQEVVHTFYQKGIQVEVFYNRHIQKEVFHIRYIYDNIQEEIFHIRCILL